MLFNHLKVNAFSIKVFYEGLGDGHLVATVIAMKGAYFSPISSPFMVSATKMNYV